MGRIIRYVYGNIRLCYLLYDDMYIYYYLYMLVNIILKCVCIYILHN